jgi:hypothetical protein
MPFYRSKSIVYNAWFTGVSTISSDKDSIGRLTSSLHRKAHMSVGAQRRARFAMAATLLHRGGGRVNPYPRIHAHT